jgi:hypothetical protein
VPLITTIIGCSLQKMRLREKNRVIGQQNATATARPDGRRRETATSFAVASRRL